MLTLKIFLDAETLPPKMNEKELQAFKEDLKVPKTIKKEEKIAEWIETNFEQKYRDLAKKSSTATVASLAYGFNDDDIECIYDEERDEKKLLEAFYSDIRESLNNQLQEGSIDEANYSIKWIGFNCRKFDLDLLWKRAKYYGLHELADLIPRDRWSKDIIDIMEIFQGPNTMDFISQDKVCKYFGIEGKPDGIDGSKVYDYWMAGRYDEVAEYNIDDVKKVRELFKLLVA